MPWSTNTEVRNKMHRIFSADLYLEHPPRREEESLDSRMLNLLDWQPVDDAWLIFYRDGDRVGVQRVRPEWCEEIGPVALQVIAEIARQKEQAVRMASRLSCQVEALRQQVAAPDRKPDGKG